jgi:hypothetical protein
VDPALGARHASISNWGPAHAPDEAARGGGVGVSAAQEVLSAIEPLLAVV